MQEVDYQFVAFRNFLAIYFCKDGCGLAHAKLLVTHSILILNPNNVISKYFKYADRPKFGKATFAGLFDANKARLQ